MQHIAVHPPSLEFSLRWLARLVGFGVVSVFVVFALGEGVVFGLLSRSELLMMTALGVSLAGVVAGWRSEIVGGTLNIGGMLAFYALNFAATGRIPAGPLFPLLMLPGVLYVICWWRHR